ncbi:hypothetical protein JCM15519_03560 [Fundidesulfovibrio butyratiphilus]
MNRTESMMQYLTVAFGRQFVIEECIKACVNLAATLQRLKSAPSYENMGIAQSDLASAVVWCGVVSLLLGKKEVSDSAVDLLREFYLVASRREGTGHA